MSELNLEKQVEQKRKYKLGVSLSGGGAKGFAHLGVIEAMHDVGLFPEIISGTSAGAFAGVFIADGQKPRDVAKLFTERKFQEFAQFGLPQAGFFKSTKLLHFLEEHISAVNIEDLPIPLRIIATDIEFGTFQEFKDGLLARAVTASCSVPIVFSPVEIDGRYYVDGGLLKNFPVTNIRKECQKVIGVNVSPIRPARYKNSFKYVAERSFHYMSSSNTLLDCKACDYLIESKNLSSYSMFDLDNVMEIFDTGYNLALKYFEKNKEKLKIDFDIDI